MASADDAVLSVTIPLKKTIRAMKEKDVAQEEEGSFPRLSGQSFTSGSEDGFLQQHRPGTQLSSQDTVLEDEEEG